MQDLNTFRLCYHRAKQDNGYKVDEASNYHAAHVLKASSFVLACKRAVCVFTLFPEIPWRVTIWAP